MHDAFERIDLRRQGGVQVGAMQLTIGRAVDAQMLVGERKAPNLLAAVMQAKNVSLRPDALRHDFGAGADMVQDVHRIGTELNAGANLAKARGLLKDFDRVASLEQTAGRTQPANACTCDQHLRFHY
jgi:hypothetical protein